MKVVDYLLKNIDKLYGWALNEYKHPLFLDY